MESTLLTKAELATLLRVSLRTIDNYVRQATLPAPIHIGRRALWHRAHISELLNPSAPAGTP